MKGITASVVAVRGLAGPAMFSMLSSEAMVRASARRGGHLPFMMSVVPRRTAARTIATARTGVLRGGILATHAGLGRAKVPVYVARLPSWKNSFLGLSLPRARASAGAVRLMTSEASKGTSTPRSRFAYVWGRYTACLDAHPLITNVVTATGRLRRHRSCRRL